MKRTIFISIVLFVLLCSANAQIPNLLNQQGFLTDTSGAPLNGFFSMTFNLYTDSLAGTLEFTQTFPSVTVTKGSYSVILDVTGENFNQQLWMETQVASSTLSPRIRLTSAPYSLNSLWMLGPKSEATGVNSIAGGTNNRARGSFSVVSGGGGLVAADSNSATGNFATVGGGKSNVASGSSVVAGGQFNNASGGSSAIGGGYMNTASGSQSTVSGGWTNTASGLQATIAGGDGNEATGQESFIGGGEGNDATGNRTVIGGGSYNDAAGLNSFVGGGQYNNAVGNYSAVLGGGGPGAADSNTASGAFSSVSGGRANTASGEYSFAAGRYAKAETFGSFVWNSGSSAFSSTDSMQFLINADGGVGINTGSPNSELHVRNSSSSVGNAASLELEAAGLNVDADASIIFNIGTDQLMVPQTQWSLGLDDTNNEFVLSKDDTLGNEKLLKITDEGNTTIYNSDGLAAVELLAEDGSTGAQIQLSEKGGSTSITIMAEEGGVDGGAYIKMYDGSHNKTLELDANYDGSGKSRVITDEIEIQGGSDFAEPFELTVETTIEPGTVMVIDSGTEGKLMVSETAYDKKVAGIVSGAGGVNPGLTLRQEGMLSGNTLVAIAGRVYCKVDASHGAIEPGDLLTTSETPGHAMKASDPDKSHGTIIGKAMTSLKEGKGLVLVLVNLQ